MSGRVYFVSGGNRGIGFQFVKLLSSNPENTVIASARDPAKATELQALADSQKNVKIVKLDVSDKASVDALDAQLEDVAKDGIDVLIANAGISQSVLPAIDTAEEVYLRHYRTNVLGPIFLTKALYPYLKLKETKHLTYVSSLAGSIGGFIPFTSSAYGQSKAALNYSIKEISFELGAEGFTAVAMQPGLVDTDMSRAGLKALKEVNPDIVEILKDYPNIPAEESAKSQLENIIFKLNKDMNGKFFDYHGVEQVF